MTTRPSRLTLAVVLVLVVALSTAGYVWTTTGHSLEPGSSIWHGADAQTLDTDHGAEVRFAFAPGGQITFGASIRNPGPWPVAITEVAPLDPFKIVRVAMTKTDRASDPATAIPFGTTTLSAGEELVLFFTVTIPDVEMAPGASLYFSELPIDYRVLGMSRHELVPMGFRLAVHAAA